MQNEEAGPGSLARSLGLSPAQARVALAAAHEVARADGAHAAPRTAHLLDVLACGLGVEASDCATPPTASELGAAFASATARKALADGLVVVACIEGEVSAARQVAVASLAARLAVESTWVDLLDALRHRRVFAVKRALVKNSPDARRLFARLWAEEGIFGVARAFLFVAGLYRDGALAARFRRLAEFPPDSFGRAVADHFAARSIAYPGEAGGVPERMFHHDLMHVVNGYDTDPAGECELAGFYAGHASGEPFTFVVTALATFHLGLRVSPAIVRPERGAFDPERVLAAFLRGRRLSVDVMGPWDYWSLMPLPLPMARRAIGIGTPTH